MWLLTLTFYFMPKRFLSVRALLASIEALFYYKEKLNTPPDPSLFDETYDNPGAAAAEIFSEFLKKLASVFVPTRHMPQALSRRNDEATHFTIVSLSLSLATFNTITANSSKKPSLSKVKALLSLSNKNKPS